MRIKPRYTVVSHTTEERRMILMEKIIAQILVRMQEGIIKKIHDKGLTDIGAVAEEILGVLKDGTCELLSGIL